MSLDIKHEVGIEIQFFPYIYPKYEPIFFFGLSSLFNLTKYLALCQYNTLDYIAL